MEKLPGEELWHYIDIRTVRMVPGPDGQMKSTETEWSYSTICERDPEHRVVICVKAGDECPLNS